MPISAIRPMPSGKGEGEVSFFRLKQGLFHSSRTQDGESRKSPNIIVVNLLQPGGRSLKNPGSGRGLCSQLQTTSFQIGVCLNFNLHDGFC